MSKERITLSPRADAPIDVIKNDQDWLKPSEVTFFKAEDLRPIRKEIKIGDWGGDKVKSRRSADWGLLLTPKVTFKAKRPGRGW